MRDPRHHLRRGFSFVELLFAIMILGIGFIMIAAIFPVAIKQTAASGEETVASTIAKGAVGVIQQNASNALMPGTGGKVVVIGPTNPTSEVAATGLWSAISGNMILPSDNRYAWSAMYERDASHPPYAQVIVIGMQVRNRTQYTSADTTWIAPSNNKLPSQPNLQPKQVQIYFYQLGNGTAPDEVTFITNYNGYQIPEIENATAVAEGSYLIIDDDMGHSKSTTGATCNGYIYRIGSPVTGPGVPINTWTLIPGNDVNSQQSALASPQLGSDTTNQMNAFIVGRSIHDPTVAYDPTNNPYEGLAQDISIYVTFVRINN
jgi:prepilin-type N-terminal cleavage/methylation domain-containing protein